VAAWLSQLAFSFGMLMIGDIVAVRQRGAFPINEAAQQHTMTPSMDMGQSR
jgi:hypothetical protein